MPLRFPLTSAALTAQLPAPPAAAWSCHRFFHASRRTLHLETNASSSANHYETLNVHPTASPAEIKKSFYHLSKRHHPDHNPTDPHAPTRFMRISEAYAVLSHADKRARYDRHHGHNHPHGNQHHHPQPGASYHSTGPAGGRPASGLSRRRGTYQGPPPSFYRTGGWGAHGAKRRAAHEESTGGAGSAGSGFGTDAHSHQNRHAGPGPGTGGGSGVGAGPPPPPPPPPPPGGGGFGAGFGGGAAGGMGPGQDPFGHRGDVPHFDHEAHERTQRRGDERRAHRRAREKGVNIDQPETSTTVSFLGAVAILAIVVMGPFLITGMSGGNSSSRVGEREKAKGNNNKDKGRESAGR
ncbi:hypothetical protein B0I37DRAFT_448916 [Chaetomium sp. MPI-CAGE-AT-0009]|nr:hypothetical protein B0I37DRAFT_448916 [Chaetomium sp. MPI-CAGE-AT-0009]